MRPFRFCFCTMLIFTFSFSQAKAKTYVMKSLEGERVVINLTDTLSGRVLVVSCSIDTLFLNEYIGKIESVQVLKEHFLQIVYDVRGGSGVNLRNTAVLSVSKGKINPSLLIDSYAYSISPDKNNTSLLDREGFYSIKLNMKGENKANYKLLAAILDKQTSKSDLKENYVHNSQIALSFDTSRHIFYNKHVKLSKAISICNPKNFNTEINPLHVDEIVPVMDLGKNAVYNYINGEWYHQGFQDVFYKEYYR